MSLPSKNKFSLRSGQGNFFEGKKYFLDNYTVMVKHNPDSKSSRFAILLSKKISKKATERNKIRRRTSYLIKKKLPLFPLNNYLFLPKKTVLTIPFSSLTSDLERLLLKLA